MNAQTIRKRVCAFGVFLGLFLLIFSCAAQPRLDVVEFSSRVLAKNPLRDPAARKVAVFLPSQFAARTNFPAVYYLSGYGSSSEKFIQQKEKWLAFVQRFSDEVSPIIFVVVDGRTRWGGSQYLNSPAQGNYADYVCDEIRKKIDRQFVSGKQFRIIAGHSSGGFGALRLGMERQKLFRGVVALSPDSDFEISHLPLVCIPAVSNAPLAQINDCMLPEMSVPPPQNGDLKYAIGLSAAYAARGRFHPGEFDWLYDGNGNFRGEIWQRWMENDPLTIAQKNSKAFSRDQSVISKARRKTNTRPTSARGKFTRRFAIVRRAALFTSRPANTATTWKSVCNAGSRGF